MKKFRIYDACVIALLAALVFALEQLLAFLPNIQLTIFLLVLFSKKLGLIKTSIIIIIHTLLDNLFMSSLNLAYFPFMLIGWLIIPITLNTIFKRVNSNIALAFLGILFSVLYSWSFLLGNVLFMNVRFLDYFIADIPFEIILALSSFLSILLLYIPLSKLFDRFYKSN